MDSESLYIIIPHVACSPIRVVSIQPNLSGSVIPCMHVRKQYNTIIGTKLWNETNVPILHSTNVSCALAFLCCLDMDETNADTISAETKLSFTH